MGSPTLSPLRHKKITTAMAVWIRAAPFRSPSCASSTGSPLDFVSDSLAKPDWERGHEDGSKRDWLKLRLVSYLRIGGKAYWHKKTKSQWSESKPVQMKTGTHRDWTGWWVFGTLLSEVLHARTLRFLWKTSRYEPRNCPQNPLGLIC